MHMVSKKDLNKAELETVNISKNPTMVVTANGEVQTKEEAMAGDGDPRQVHNRRRRTREGPESACVQTHFLGEWHSWYRLVGVAKTSS